VHRQTSKDGAVKINALFTTIAAFQHRLLLIKRQLFSSPPNSSAILRQITGTDAVIIEPKYRDAYSTYIFAVILVVNNNPMRSSDHRGGASRRRYY